MFCPKCGSVLTWRWDTHMKQDVFYCVPGDMWMSVNLTQKLLDRFGVQESGEEPEAVPPHRAQLHSRLPWYCPGCGVRLHEDLTCGRCGKGLQDLLFTLVELHPHLGEMPPTSGTHR